MAVLLRMPHAATLWSPKSHVQGRLRGNPIRLESALVIGMGFVFINLEVGIELIKLLVVI